MTRCIRLPAPRGSITDRHDAPLAVNAADVGSGVDRVLVVPALLRARPADVDRLAELTGRPREELHAQLAAAADTTLSLPVAEVPRGTGDAVTAAGIAGVFVVAGAAPGVPDRRRCSDRCSASPGWPRPRTRSAGPTCRRARSSAGPASSSSTTRCCAGSTGDSACTSTRRACRSRSASGRTPCPAPTCGSRSTWACSGGWTPAWPRPCARSPGPAAGSAPPSRWTRDRGRSSPSRARRRSTTTSTGRRSTPRALQGLAGAPGSPMLEHVTQAVAPPGSTFKLVVAAANQAHPVFAPAPGHPHRGRLHLRRPHLRQLEADGPDEPGAVDRHLQRRLLLQARRRARGRTR